MIWLGKQPAERHSCVGSPRGRSSMGFAPENQGSYRTPRWRKGDSNPRSLRAKEAVSFAKGIR